jgi:hypothetical protein
MYLTFDEQDSVEDIVAWLFPRVEGRASSLLVAGEKIGITAHELEMAIKKETLLRIGPG